MKWTSVLFCGLVLVACGSEEGTTPLGPSSGVEDGGVSVPEGAQPQQLVGPIELFARSNDEGIVIEEYQYYLDGSRRIMHGFYRTFWNDGNQREAGAFVRNQKTGDWRYYDETGDLMISFEVWESGAMLQQMTYYPDGTMRSETHFATAGGTTTRRRRRTRTAKCTSAGSRSCRLASSTRTARGCGTGRTAPCSTSAPTGTASSAACGVGGMSMATKRGKRSGRMDAASKRPTASRIPLPARPDNAAQ